MPTEVILPRVDMDMSEGKISRWLVRNGQRVSKGDTIFEIETDKAAMEVEAPSSGIIQDIAAEEGAVVPVGVAVAWIFGESEAYAPPEPAAPAPPAASASASMAEPQRPAAAMPRLTNRVAATPKARRLARETGIDLASLTGSGPRGRIQADDLAIVAELPAQAPAAAVLNLVTRGDLAAEPAILIHGFGADLSIWKTTLAELDPGLATVQVDLPAHGKSPLGEVRSFEGIAATVTRSLADLKLSGCHLIGHSFGGMIALAIAVEARLPVRSLMMISPAGLGPDIEREFVDGFTRSTRVESLTPWLRLLFAKPSLVTPAFAKAIMRGRDSEQLRDQQRAIADTMFPDGTQANDLRAALDRLSMPCKIVWGRQDRIIPMTHSANLPGHIGLHLLADTGHVPHLEQPRLVARLIRELIRSAG